MNTLPEILQSKEGRHLQVLEASSNYTYLTYANGEKAVSAYSLKVFAEHFAPKHFIRINRHVLWCTGRL